MSAYADYEQLVGGVKTLFGTEIESVEEYAKSVGKTVDEVKDEYDSLNIYFVYINEPIFIKL